MRARIALSVISSEFNKVKMQFVKNAISEEEMSVAQALAARKVASVKAQFSTRQKQINESFRLLWERARTMKDYVSSDVYKL